MTTPANVGGASLNLDPGTSSNAIFTYSANAAGTATKAISLAQPSSGTSGFNYFKKNYDAAVNAVLMSSTTAVSAEAWVKFDRLPSVQGAEVTVFSYYNSSTGYKIFADDSTNFLSFRVNGTTIASTTAVTLGTWYHVVGTFNGATTTQTLYVNGASVASNTSADSTILAVPNTTTTKVAGESTGSSGTKNVNGVIDNVRIYSSALTLPQVQSQYSMNGNQTP